MTKNNRRQAMQLLGFAATAPIIALGLRATPAMGTPITHTPEGRYLLTRQLTRGLGDGKAVIVTRKWVCHFTPQERGMRVSGEQVDVQVQAPEVLAPIAEIERKRVVNGLFPATLDQFGRLVGEAPEPAQRDVSVAVDEALSLYKQKAADLAVQQQASEFLRNLSQAGAQMITAIQPDLFFPETGQRREDRTIELPNGDIGSFEVTVNAETHESTGLLKLISRKVVTRIADSARLSSENWSMQLA